MRIYVRIMHAGAQYLGDIKFNAGNFNGPRTVMGPVWLSG